MTSTQLSAPLKEVVGDAKVIDNDTHYTEPPDLWTSRAPAAYKDKVPHMKTVNGQSMWFIEGEKPWGNIGVTVVDKEEGKHRGIFTLATFDEISRAAYEVKPRLELMDRAGIYAQIVYPNACGFGATRFLEIEDPELRVQCVKIYNDAIAEWQAESKGRLFPQGFLPFWDLEATLAETRRVKEELRLTGVTLTDRAEVFGVPDYSAPHWAPFWELVNDLELPVDFHVGAGVRSIVLQDYAWGSFSLMQSIATLATIMYMDNARMINNFILSGLFDRYPKLKFVSVESGCGWIPFLIEAMEWHWNELAPEELAHLKRRPREYFKDHFYVTFWFEDRGVKHFIESVGADNLLFETDFPHPTCLYPESQEHLARVLAKLEPAVRRRVVQDNAAELYKIPIPVQA